MHSPSVSSAFMYLYLCRYVRGRAKCFHWLIHVHSKENKTKVLCMKKARMQKFGLKCLHLRNVFILEVFFFRQSWTFLNFCVFFGWFSHDNADLNEIQHEESIVLVEASLYCTQFLESWFKMNAPWTLPWTPAVVLGPKMTELCPESDLPTVANRT